MYLGQGGPHSPSASSLFLKLGDKNIITIKNIFSVCKDYNNYHIVLMNSGPSSVLLVYYITLH